MAMSDPYNLERFVKVQNGVVEAIFSRVVEEGSRFHQALEKCCGEEPDVQTLKILGVD
jgi:uncharacterized protein (DUF1810 family)